MAEQINILSPNKEGRYRELLPQLESLLGAETDPIANMANCCAALRETFGFFWVGFYLVRNDELVLGPFQGPLACTRIARGKGVCGAAWEREKPVIVEDVDAFPGHIACSSLSKSEIVVPLIEEGSVWAVLDVDSEQLSFFDKTDEKYLMEIVQLIRPEKNGKR